MSSLNGNVRLKYITIPDLTELVMTTVTNNNVWNSSLEFVKPFNHDYDGMIKHTNESKALKWKYPFHRQQTRNFEPILI